MTAHCASACAHRALSLEVLPLLPSLLLPLPLPPPPLLALLSPLRRLLRTVLVLSFLEKDRCFSLVLCFLDCFFVFFFSCALDGFDRGKDIWAGGVVIEVVEPEYGECCGTSRRLALEIVELEGVELEVWR